MNKYKKIEKGIDKEYNNYIHKNADFYFCEYDYYPHHPYYCGDDWGDDYDYYHYYPALNYEYDVNLLYYVSVYGYKISQKRLVYKKVDIFKCKSLFERRNIILDKILKEDKSHDWGSEKIEVNKKYILKNWNVIILVIDKSKNRSFIRLYEDIDKGGFWIDNKELKVKDDRNI